MTLYIYIYIDKVGLEDWTMVHEAEFGITDGYYYTDGRTETINHVIAYISNFRFKLKKGINPAQMVMKLLINSMYGKTLTKPIETDTVVKDNQNDFDK